jgi:hypothetical protein
LKELWQHLPEHQRQSLLDRLTIMLQRQFLNRREGGSDE